MVIENSRLENDGQNGRSGKLEDMVETPECNTYDQSSTIYKY